MQDLAGLRVAESFEENEIVSAVQRQLNWTHLKTLAYIKGSMLRCAAWSIGIPEHLTRRLTNSFTSEQHSVVSPKN